MKRVWLTEKKVEGRRYFWEDFGNTGHGRPSFRLWVHHSLVKLDHVRREYYVELPVGGSLSEGKSSRTVILRPGKNWISDYWVPCGFRGESYIEIIEGEVVNVFRYQVWHSPRGNLGISWGVLFEAKGERIKIAWKRSGRLYGKPSFGFTIIYRDGNIEEIDVEDMEEIKDLGG